MSKPTDQASLDALKQREGLRLDAYQDSSGVWTIGYGHTGPDVLVGTSITQQQADDLFLKDSIWAVDCVDNNVKVGLTPNQRGALFSFVYNIGSGAFISSTLLKKLNNGDYASVPSEMLRWTISGGVKDPGLVNRRNSEGGQWVQGAYVRGSKIDIESPPPIWRSPKVKALGTAIAGVTGTQITSAAVQAQTLSQSWHSFVYVFGALTVFGIVWALIKHEN